MPTEVETIARGQNIITCNVKLHVVGPLLVIRLCSAIHFVYVCGNDRFVLIFVFFFVVLPLLPFLHGLVDLVRFWFV